jgi:hypothetical protein
MRLSESTVRVLPCSNLQDIVCNKWLEKVNTVAHFRILTENLAGEINKDSNNISNI